MRWPQRLSSRLSVSFVALFVCTFAAVAFITIYFAQRNYARSIDDTLGGVAETLDERLQTTDPSNIDARRALVTEQSSAALFVQLVSLSGDVVTQSPNIGLRPLPTFVASHPMPDPGFHTARYRNARVRLVRYPLHRDGELEGYAIVATPIETVNDSIADLVIVVGAAGVIGTVLAVTGTLWLSRREAAPLQELADDARRTVASGFEEPIVRDGPGSLEARELRLALADLVERQQERLRRERAFFADSSHVLRTPLAVLMGEVELLEQGVSGPERDDAVTEARAAIATLTRAVNGLLLLAREQDAPEGSWEVLDLGALLKGVSTAAAIASPTLRVECTIDGRLEVAGDTQQLRDLFTSIVENACRYTPAGGSVTITARPDAATGDAVIEIRDTGIGLDADDSARATERFYRGAGARRMFPGGSGLGLAIALRIAGMHHGTLVLSGAPGEGTLARLTLPLVS